jgi:translation elongation factor EF-4
MLTLTLTSTLTPSQTLTLVVYSIQIAPDFQVLNKIDLPGVDPEHVRKEMEEIIGVDCS